MLLVNEMAKQVSQAMRYHKRPLVAYHLYFSLLALFALSPLSAWALAGLVQLSGYSMVGNEDLVRFILTPTGFAWLLVSGSFIAFLLFFHAAGLMLIAALDKDDRFHSATNALWTVLKRFPALFKLAAIQVLCHLLLASPVLALLIVFYQWLLGSYDIYYVINVYPTELFIFAPIALLLMAALVLGNGALYVSWSLALPALLLDKMRPRTALAKSWQLVKGSRLHIGRIILLVALAVALLPVIFTVVFDAIGAALMNWLPGPAALQIGMMGALIVLYVVIAVGLAFIAISANSLLLLKVYLRCSGQTPVVFKELEPRNTGPLAWAFELVLILFAVAQLAYVAQSFESQDEVLTIAHRGASWDAPENSLSAIKAAIDQGADYIELDLQQTADGTLVILHDRDLLRIAGDPRSIWDVTYAELSAMDAGSWFSPAFFAERVPTLEQAIELIRGRAQLYLEVKTAAQMPSLVEDTVAELQRLDFVDQTLVVGLSSRMLEEIREREPRLRTGLLIHTAIGTFAAHNYEVLGLRDALLTASQLRAARDGGYNLHVWTVNSRNEMHRFLDMGVDGIITDVPEVLQEVIAERKELNATERLLLRMRHWVW